MLQGTSVVEFGAGHGCYTSFLRGKGLRVSAYDGIEGVAELDLAARRDGALRGPQDVARGPQDGIPPLGG